MVYNFHSGLLLFLGAVLKTSHFFLKIMHKVKTQRFGELLVKNMLIVYFYVVMIKTYKVKKNSLTNFQKDWNKFPEIFRGKFREISQLTALLVCHLSVIVVIIRCYRSLTCQGSIHYDLCLAAHLLFSYLCSLSCSF